MPSQPKQSGDKQQLHDLVEEMADQLCPAVDGEFNFSINVSAHDESIDKLQMLINLVLDSARRSFANLNAKAARLQKVESYNRTIVETARDGIITINGSGIIETFSPAAAEMFGYTPDEVVGRNVIRLMQRPDADEHDQHLRRYLQTGDTTIFETTREVTGKRKDSTRFPLELSVSEASINNRTLFVGIVRDITCRKESEREIAALARFPDENPEPVLRVARDGAILYANKSSTDLLRAWGIEADGLVPDHFGSSVVRVFDSGRSEEVENQCGGRTFALLVVPVIDADYANVYGRDVTERNQIVRDLEAARETAEAAQEEMAAMNDELERSFDHANRMALAAEASNQAKSEFLANMSHEIRTPMTAILGFVEVLKQSVEKPENSEVIGIIERNGQHLVRLINDILDLAKIEAGKLEIELEDCCVFEFISDVTSLMRQRATEKSLRLDVKFTSSVPKVIRTDTTRLRQALTNLISNAIKFTEEGRITVEVSLLGSSSVPQLLFRITDTGIGIPEEKLGAIFEPFEQADNSTTRKFGGTGLGLAICKQIAELLGGGLEVQSD